MARRRDSFRGLYSCRVFTGDGTQEFSSGSEEEDDDDNASDEEFVPALGIQAPADINGSSSRLPDRWDVLGLGQAMVIHSISWEYFSETCPVFFNLLLNCDSNAKMEGSGQVDLRSK